MSHRIILALYIFAVLPAGALASEYFPFQVGNQWVYQQSDSTPGEPVIVQVLESEVVGEQEYFLVAGLTPSAAWLRLSEDGALLRLHRESGREAIWAIFSKGVGETYDTAIDPCNPFARVDAVSAREDVPAGVFDNVLSIGSPALSRADAGLQYDHYAPGIGLIQRTVTTLAGPQAMSLIYARVGDKTAVSRPEVLFGLSLGRAVYSGRLHALVLSARIIPRVQQPERLGLSSPFAQRFKLVLKNNQGEGVYRWPDGRAFDLLFVSERIGPGERNWMVEVPLQTRESNECPLGKYIAECWMTTKGERRYAATAGFGIAAWQETARGLSGNWLFEARTSEGLLRAGLSLQSDGKRLSASLRIDNHVLKGEGETDGMKFDVLLVHTDGSGPGHSERLRLCGRLEDDRIEGSFDSGIDHGGWTGRRVP